MPIAAPQTAYQGSKDMKRYEGSSADRARDKSSGYSERSAKERASDKKEASRGKSASVGQAERGQAERGQARRTLVGKHKRPRVTMSQTSFGGDDIGS